MNIMGVASRPDGVVREHRSIPLSGARRDRSDTIRMWRTGQEDAVRAPAAPDLTFHLLTRGAFAYRADFGFGAFGGVKRPGEFDVAPPGRVREMRLIEPIADPIEELILAIPFTRIRAIAATSLERDLADFGPLHARMTDCPSTARVLESLWSEAATSGAHLRLFAEGALIVLIALLIRHAGGQPRPRAAGGLAPRQIRRVTEYLESHLAEDISLPDLAAVAGLSPFHFARAFKTSLGAPPGAYHRSLRVDRARALLRGTDTPITEIAAQVGYEAPQALARVFRREVGVSPSEYRRGR